MKLEEILGKIRSKLFDSLSENDRTILTYHFNLINSLLDENNLLPEDFSFLYELKLYGAHHVDAKTLARKMNSSWESKNRFAAKEAESIGNKLIKAGLCSPYKKEERCYHLTPDGRRTALQISGSKSAQLIPFLKEIEKKIADKGENIPTVFRHWANLIKKTINVRLIPVEIGKTPKTINIRLIDIKSLESTEKNDALRQICIQILWACPYCCTENLAESEFNVVSAWEKVEISCASCERIFSAPRCLFQKQPWVRVKFA